ncbi:MAG TPA: hypothetical protein PKH39_13890 [Woeseiaceae bacterium]|nr:hypothetical protein [Woeseiaceae bacterium]
MRALILALLLCSASALAEADIDGLRAEANIAVNAGETDVAVAKLRQLLDLAPDDGSAHYQLGTLIMDSNGELFDAIRHFERAQELKFQPLGVAYRLSRIYARMGNKEKALEQMDALASGGFNLPGYFENQPDYDSIRQDAGFIDAVEAVRAARFPCEADERHHAFDFWIGEWTVTVGGTFAGTNSIQPILGHCALLEQWESAAGTSGKSYNYYDPGYDHWRQIWISDSGSFIEFTGVARDGGIFYTAETINPADDSTTLHKFEFTQIGNGVVRQFWQTSSDNGETWTPIWDAKYARRTD